MFLGNRIKEVRLLKKFKNYELAKMSGISNVYLSDIERNIKTPKFETLERICTALNITLTDFFAPAGEGVEPLSPELHRLLESAKSLSPDQLN